MNLEARENCLSWAPTLGVDMSTQYATSNNSDEARFAAKWTAIGGFIGGGFVLLLAISLGYL